MEDVFPHFVGEQFYFYGAVRQKFRIDDMILLASKRPYYGDIDNETQIAYIGHDDDKDTSIFSDKPLGRIEIQELDTGPPQHFLGWSFIDIDTGFVWLKIGTAPTFFKSNRRTFSFDYMHDKEVKPIDVDKSYKSWIERNPDLYIKYIDWFNGKYKILSWY